MTIVNQYTVFRNSPLARSYSTRTALYGIIPFKQITSLSNPVEV